MSPSTFVYTMIFVISLGTACSSKVLILKTNPPAQVDLLSVGKFDDAGKDLGKTPLTIEVEQILGGILRVTQEGKSPVYWLVSEAAGETTEVELKLPEASRGDFGGSVAGSRDRAASNRLLRLILGAYQAISDEQYQLARDLADQASRIDPELAAPEVLRGLANFKEGKISEAKAAFIKAKALDPEDKNIDELTKAVP